MFGRAKVQADVIRTVTDSYRRRLMATLRITFLSSLALELLASVSVALIAVAIGLRLLDGRIGLQAGLFVLILAPEAYLPLRQLGTEYHASAEGSERGPAGLRVLWLRSPLEAIASRYRIPRSTGTLVIRRFHLSGSGSPSPVTSVSPWIRDRSRCSPGRAAAVSRRFSLSCSAFET